MTLSHFPEGNAIVYCDGAFNTLNGKTAHGLIRFTQRYKVLSVVDSHFHGQDSGMVLDGKPNRIPIYPSIEAAFEAAKQNDGPATHLVVGIAPDGGRLSAAARLHIKIAIQYGLHIDSGLHDFISDDEEMVELARRKDVRIRDIRKPPSRDKLHFFSGKIEQVDSLKIAILGTDSAIGKRTTAWLLVHALNNAGYPTEIIGTGQTAWMQGARHSIIMDSLVNDFVAGEIEHAVWSAWNDSKPKVIVIEGQGSLMNPAYPGGFEILAAGRPDFIILQHAPMRKEYDGFPGYPIQPLARQIHAIELLSGKPVAAITINHEHMLPQQIPPISDAILQVVGIPAVDVLLNGGSSLVNIIEPYLEKIQ